MNTCVKQYRKAVKGGLCCSRNTKDNLLSKFDTSLSTLLEDSPSPTKDELHQAFGPPKEMVAILMEEVPPEEIKKQRTKKTITRIILGVIIAAILAYVTAVFILVVDLKDDPITSSEEVIVDDVTIEDEVIVDDGIIVEDEIIVEGEIIVEDELIIEDEIIVE